MIVRLTGKLVEVGEDAVLLEHNGVTYEVLAPAYSCGELAARRGQTVTLHTFEYFEGSPGGGNLTPRIVGFANADDRRFFEQFTSVKGIGTRRGLRALVEPAARIARDIEAGDVKALARLPGVGPRTAQQIVAELRGKVEAFARGAAGAPPPESALSQAQRDALELLAAWGDSRSDARRWLERAAEANPNLSVVEDWVKAAYRMKAGAGG